MSHSLEEQVQEVESMWDNDEYDNFKDAIEDCTSLLDEIPNSKATLRKTIERVMTEATTEAQTLVDRDPSMADYMEGLIDPSWLSEEYLASKKK